MSCRDIVLDTNAIPFLAEIKNKVRDSDIIFIQNDSWQKEWIVKSRGYGWQLASSVKKAKEQLESRSKLIFKTIKTLPRDLEEHLREVGAKRVDIGVVKVAYWRVSKGRKVLILTGNVEHFPPNELEQYKIEVYRPETYLEDEESASGSGDRS
ncbi:hypothetical protein M1O52_02965 [Dehalococcoidia bacterium]|nr:hypothetical protein [Dehalococcoidia bacterium]